MGHLTFFAAALTCPKCGVTSTADTATGMSNHLSPKFGGEVLKVGDRRAFGEGDFGESFDLLVRPSPGAPIHILHDWICPSCGEMLWADVTFEEGTLARIDVVPFERTSVARAHYISDRVSEYYESVTGKQLHPGYDGDYRRLIEELLMLAGTDA